VLRGVVFFELDFERVLTLALADVVFAGAILAEVVLETAFAGVGAANDNARTNGVAAATLMDGDLWCNMKPPQRHGQLQQREMTCTSKIAPCKTLA
jgi:hypothetical protein